MKLRRDWKKTIVYIVFALVIALAVEFFSCFDCDSAVKTIWSNLERRAYSAQELTGQNLQADSQGHTVCFEDPGFVTESFHVYLECVELRLSEITHTSGDLIPLSIPVQIFVSEDGVNFTEEHLFELPYPEKQSAVFAHIGCEAAAVRVDIGENGDEYIMHQIILNPNAGDYCAAAAEKMNMTRIFLYFLAVSLLLAALADYKKLLHTLFVYRWWIGLSVIALCTVLRLHGSSIGFFVSNILGGEDTALLWGIPRGIRSDEFVAFTPMAFAQSQSGFNWMSQLWGYSPRDMFIVYGQPVMSLVTLFRPFSVGYILFGKEMGLAFYWSSRMVILFLVSFEFGRLLTKDRRQPALAYALLVSLAPVVQWWFSINELVEMLIFLQASVLLFRTFLLSRSLPVKAACTAALTLCAGGFALALYPAWMIPLFYVLIACMAAMLIENRREISVQHSIPHGAVRAAGGEEKDGRISSGTAEAAGNYMRRNILTDVLFLSAAAAVLVVSLLHILHNSWGTIQSVMNTCYPGGRNYTGGDAEQLTLLFEGWTSWLWSFAENENPCEFVGFLNFFPIGLILSAAAVFKEKKKDTWLIALNIASLAMTLFILLPLPEAVGKVTMLSVTSAARMIVIIGFAQLLVLIRALAVMDYHERLYRLAIPCCVLFCVLSFYVNPAFMTPVLKWVTILIGTGMVFLLGRYQTGKDTWQEAFLISVLVFSMIGGGLVNPVSQGLGSLYDNNIVKAMEKINEEERGLWVSAGSGSWLLANLPPVIGARNLNALAIYPDQSLWTELGLESGREIWNRYAHLTLYITTDPESEAAGWDPEESGSTYSPGEEGVGLTCAAAQASAVVTNPDSITLFITVPKLKELGVNYILSTTDLSQFDGLECICQFPEQQKSIWRIQ